MEEPGIMTRTASYHSVRIKEGLKKGKIKSAKTPDEEELYLEGDYLAVRCPKDDPEPFYLCMALETVTTSTETLLTITRFKCVWLELQKEGATNIYGEGTEDTIHVDTIYKKVRLTQLNDDTLRLSSAEKKSLLKIVKQDRKEDEEAEEKEPEEEEEDEEPSEEEADRKTKRRKTGKSTSSKKAPKKTRKKKAKDEEEDASTQAEEDGAKGKKKRKRQPKEGSAKGGKTTKKRQAKPKATKKKKGPNTRTAEDPDPNIEIIEKDPRFFSDSPSVHSSCCTQCSSKELIRAVLTNNMDLLKTALEDRTHIHSFFVTRSADCTDDCLSIAIEKDNTEAIQLILEASKNEDAVHDPPLKPRPRPPTVRLSGADTGSYDMYTYGHAVRKLNVSRGGKEGNTAFGADLENNRYWSRNRWNDSDEIRHKVFRTPLSKPTLQLLLTKCYATAENVLAPEIATAVRYGNTQVAGYLVERFVAGGGWGFNFLHKEALLNTNQEFTKFKGVSVWKKPLSNLGITPVHMAAINPNPKYLKELLESQAASTVEDDEGRTPVHYAAACTSSGPLEYLISIGVDYTAADVYGVTPLMIAADTGRLHNLKTLLKLNMKSDMFKNLVEDKEMHQMIADKINEVIGEPKEKNLTDDMIAETVNAVLSDELCQKFLSSNDTKTEFSGKKESNVDDADMPLEEPAADKSTQSDGKTEESAMEIESTQQQDEVQATQQDELQATQQEEQEKEEEESTSSKSVNKAAVEATIPYVDATDLKGYTALCYAAESGNAECVKFLIERTASVNIHVVDQKLTPLMLAARKGHLEVVKILLDNGAFIDRPDKLKRSALIHAVKNGHLPVASYLISRGADFTTCDSSKNSVLHYAAAYGWSEIVSYLAKLGADTNAFNDWKVTPLAAAMMKGHIGCADILLECKGVDVNIRDDEGCTLISLIIKTDFTEDSLKQIEYLCTKGADVNVPDINSETPLHHLARISGNKDISPELCVKAADVLLSNGAVLETPNKNSETPMAVLLSSLKCVPLIKFLLEKGAKLGNCDLAMTYYVNNAFSQDLSAAYELLIQHEEFIEAAHSLDDNGYTPFLRLMKNFISWLHAPIRDMQFKSWNSDERKKEEKAEKKKRIEEKITVIVRKFIRDLHIDVSETVQKVKEFRNVSETEMSDESDEVKKHYGTDGKCSAMHLLVGQNEVKLIEVVLEFHPNLNVLDMNYNSPLHIAIDRGDKDIIQALMTFIKTAKDKGVPNGNGLDINLQNKEGKTYLYQSIEEGNQELAKLLLDIGADVNIPTTSGFTPLNLAVWKGYGDLVNQLCAKGAQTDVANLAGKYPLHYCTQLSIAQQLVKCNASIHRADASGKTPLHLAVIRRNVALAAYYLECGADVNVKCNKKRTPLHYAVNSCSPSMDSLLDLEELLIQKGAKANELDIKNRTPLHYAFVKTGTQGFFSTEKVDPIEVVTTLWTLKDIQIDLPDIYGKTPLHYAAQCNANISVLFLLQRGANLEAEDKEGNTPLGIAMQSGHPDLAVTLIQKNANVKHKIEVVKRRTEPLYENVETVDSNGKKKTVRVKKGGSKDILSQHTASMFVPVVKHSWQGVAYLMLDAGFDFKQAIEDAVKHNQFQLAWKLLTKIREDSVIKQTNSQAQNLFHTLANCPQTTSEYFLKLARVLSDRGVPFNVLDAEQRLPLHYACMSSNLDMCRFLLTSSSLFSDNGVNAKDSSGKTPLSYAVSRGKSMAMLQLLLQNKSDPNIPDNSGITPFAYSLQRGWKKEQVKKKIIDMFMEHNANPNCSYFDLKDKEKIMETALNHAVMANDTELVSLFIKANVDTSQKSANGRTPLMNAICANRTQLVDMLLNAPTCDVNAQDNDGKTALHLVISPLEFGSYENVDILEKLLRHKGIKTDVRDNKGWPPIFYAHVQDSGRMLECLKRHNVSDVGAQMPPIRLKSDFLQWGDNSVNYEEDAEVLAKQLAAEAKEEKEKKVPVDPQFENAATSEVVRDEHGFYDILLTKVDVKHGAFGINNFYKMQVLHEKVKDIYILWNRWGRIGTTGQYQRTPYPSKEAAIAEFQKIFKSKSGNLWENKENFQKVHKKYRIVEDAQDNMSTVALQPFDLTKCPQSFLTENQQLTMKTITDVTLLQNYMKSTGINTSLMPLGTLSKERLSDARNVLLNIREVLTRIDALRNESIPDLDKLLTELELVAELSSEFYELIPHSNFSHSTIGPLDDHNQVDQKLRMINDLSEIAVARKILMGATLQSVKMNPLDYCYRALNITLDELKENSEEYSLLYNYYKNTNGNHKIMNIYKLQHKGEAERISRWKNLSNHYLLWHGSPTSNFVGILSQGLRIAPPEAPVSGYMFGKGVYFGDMAEKSISYCRSNNKTPIFLLLCEVALGNMYECLNAEYMEKPKDGFNSTVGLGIKGPDWENNKVFMPNGVAVPVGSPIVYDAGKDLPREKQRSLRLNEYIVYDTSQVRMRYLVQLDPTKRLK